jgi:RimJ/RimL family protein N-acetyltransferase
VHALDAPSPALLKEPGFVEEGLLRDAGQWIGERRDLVQPGLSKREFCGARAKQPYRPSSCA